jgi:hypothetical protein
LPKTPRRFERHKIHPRNTFLALQNYKCKVYEDHVLTSEAAKGANDIYKKFKVKVAHRYDID